MRRLLNEIPVGISAGVCILLSLMLLILPLQWIFAAIAAAGFHELCHILAVLLCGGSVRRLHIGGRGAVIEAESMTPGRELFCVLAGPLGRLLLLLAARWIPRTAVCAAFHSVYNLLPLNGLDGGLALRRITEMLWPAYADSICRWVQRICLAFLGGLAVYAALWLKLGIGPLVMVFAMLLRTKWKNPLQTAL